MLRKKNTAKPPHYKVYTRLKPSKIHGVGVFAIRDIPKGIYLFTDEAEQNMEDCWMDKEEVRKLNPEFRKLYDDFCLIKNNKYSCPKTFDLLTPGWYINHSDKPNVLKRDGGSFKTLRKIKKGEELTTSYKIFSEEPRRKWLK